MATIPLLRTPIFAILMVFFSIVLAAPGEHPGILSRLYKQASKQNRPLVIVLDNSALKTKDVKHKSVDKELEKSLPFMFMHHVDQSHKKPAAAKLPISQLLGKQPEEELEKRLIKKQEKKHKSLFKDEDDKRFLRSPVIRSLLRISNTLRCNAKNDCEDECSNKYSGKKRNQCEDRCEIKYSCEESTEDPCNGKDSCAASDSCGNEDECHVSTRGERLITVTPKCKQC